MSVLVQSSAGRRLPTSELGEDQRVDASLSRREGWPDPVTEQTDADLMKRVGAGDKRAVEELYHRYKRLVYSIAVRVLQDAATADEVTQDVFLKLWRQPGRYEPALGAFSSWLYSVAHRQSIDALRARRRHMVDPLPDPASGPEQADPGLPVEEQAERAELGYRVRQAVASLSTEQRRTLELVYFSGFTHQEIAAVEGTPLGTVKSRLRLAFQHLRSRLSESGEGRGSA